MTEQPRESLIYLCIHCGHETTQPVDVGPRLCPNCSPLVAMLFGAVADRLRGEGP